MRSIHVLLYALLIVSLVLSPLQATPTYAQTADFSAPIMQGEIAYILNGDIWLHDLSTGKARQLTTTGNNWWPVWSADGRALMFSHVKSGDIYELYQLDVESSKATLIAEDACCGTWSGDGSHIVFLTLDGDSLTLEMAAPDASNRIPLLSPVNTGLAVWPAGPIAMTPLLDSPESADITSIVAFPLAVIDMAASGDYVEYVTPFYAGVSMMSLQDPDFLSEFIDLSSCSIPYFDIRFSELQGIEQVVLAYEGADCAKVVLEAVSDFEVLEEPTIVDVQKGVALADVSRQSIEYFPWLAYPSFGPDRNMFIAERYLPTEDPQEAELWGVVLHDIATESQVDIAEGASQPAWRPGAKVDPLAFRYAQPGEYIVTLEPALQLAGDTYQVSYFTTGDLRRRDAGLFHLFTPEFFTREQVTGLLVTASGRAVIDSEVLRQVFTLYSSAYALYEEPPGQLVPSYQEELSKILGNPLIVAMEPEYFLSINPDEFIGSRRTQSEEALRTILTDQVSTEELDLALAQVAEQMPSNTQDAVEALTAILEEQYEYHLLLRQMSNDLALVYQELDQLLGQADTALFMFQLLARFLFTNQLQQERAAWLDSYLQRFPSGAGSLDRDQLRAAVQILEEAKDANAQRINTVEDFAKEIFEEGTLRSVDNLSAEAAEKLITASGGTALSSHAIASTLSAISIGLTVNSILYGTDTVVVNFKIAERSEELAASFRTGRQAIQEEAASQWPEDQIYDGELAKQFRIAYLLEALSSIQVQRAYAEGVAGTFQLPNPLDIVNWIRGDDWRSAVDELQRQANELEMELLATYAWPPFLDNAITLARGDSALTVEMSQSVRLGTMVTARRIDAGNVPVEITDTFDTTEDTIYAVAEVDFVKQDTTLVARWYRDGVPIEDSLELVADRDYTDTYLEFHLTNLEDHFEEGDYSVEVIVNGLIIGRADFVVVADASMAVTSTVEPSATLTDAVDNTVTNTFTATVTATITDTEVLTGDASTISKTMAVTVPLTVTANCTEQIEPQFVPYYDQGQLGCATSAPSVVWSAYQPFERGSMLWRSDSDTSYVFYSSGSWLPIDQGWDGSPARDRGAPPPGLQAPQRGFGYVWSHSDEMFTGLGWALDQEKGFCALVQEFERGFILRSSDVASCTPENLYNFATADDWASLLVVAVGNAQWRNAPAIPGSVPTPLPPTPVAPSAEQADNLPVGRTPPASNGMFDARYATSYTIDGRFEDWPGTWMPISTVVYGIENYNGPGDLSGNYQLGWNDNGLLLAIRVNDDIYRPGPIGSDLWQGDSIEIQFDRQLAADFDSTLADADDYRLGIAFDLSRSTTRTYLWLPFEREAELALPSAITLGEQGYQIEVLIPWYVFDITTPATDRAYGFNISVNDNDSDRAAQQTVISASPARTTHDNPTEWGTLRLLR